MRKNFSQMTDEEKRMLFMEMAKKFGGVDWSTAERSNRAYKKKTADLSAVFSAFTVGEWCLIGMFFESIDVVAGTAETAFIGNIADGFFCGTQCGDALFNAVFLKIRKDGFSCMFFEKSTAFVGAEMNDRSDLVQC